MVPDWPYPPGASPFRIKGIGYRGHVKFADAHVPGGMAASLLQIPDPALREFLSQPFLAASWYDIHPLYGAAVACSRVMGVPYAAFVRQRVELQAREDLGTVYRVILKLASVQAIALRLVRLMSDYYDYGGSTAHLARPGLVEAWRTGVPAPLVPMFASLVEPYGTFVLGMAGARDARVQAHPPQPDGASHGMQTMKIQVDLSWQP